MPETTQSISFPEQNVEIEVLEQISAERLVENMFLASVYSIAVGQDHLYTPDPDLLANMYQEGVL